MTVTYTSHVATCKGFGCFWKLLFRWRGSVYKLVWMELLAYTSIYYAFSLSYRFALDEEQKRLFEKISIFCQNFSELIPLSFVLGFYVALVVKRWWEQYLSIPWPDSLALFISTSILGQDERSRRMRRTVMRYVCLSQTITLIMSSPKVKKRFPTHDHLVEAGLMTSNEQKIFAALEEKTPHPKYWMPLVWAGSIVTRARKEGRIRDDFAVKTIIDEINRIRGLCGGLLSYDWISIPLVYTQVVTLAVYSFFIATLMGRQFLDPKQNIPNHHIDFYIPIFTFLQFFFFMGWLKVAESLVNPFGEDDDDFEVNWLVDRNLQVSYLIVDEMHNEHPELIQDIYWDEVFPQELPYTIAAEPFRRDPPMGSTANLEIPEPQQEFLPLVEEEDEDINDSLSGINIDPETGKPMDMRKNSASAASSIGALGTSQPFSSRKPSMLSMLLSKIKSGSQESLRRPGVRPNESTTSMSTYSRRQSALMRSTSRVSTASQNVGNSPEPSARAPIAKQDSAIFRMSETSLNNSGLDEVALSPRQKSRRGSGEDDESIVLKIKRRDKDGNVMIMESWEDLRFPGSKKPRKATSEIVEETVLDEQSDGEDRQLLSPDSGRPTDPPTPTVTLEETNERESDMTDPSPKKKKGLGSLNLKGFSKTRGYERQTQGDRSLTPPLHRSREPSGEDPKQEDTHLQKPPSKPDPLTPRNLLDTGAGSSQRQDQTSAILTPEIIMTKPVPPESKLSESYPSSPASSVPLPTTEPPQQQSLKIVEGEGGGDARKKAKSESELESIPESEDTLTHPDSENLIV